MKIRLNAEPYECSYKTVTELRHEVFCDEDIIIINGFQTSADCSIVSGDEIFVIPKGVMPPREQLEAMMCARHTPRVHEAVKKACVGIAGLGGLGSNIAVSLARTGVGKLVLADFDTVEPSNLNRQNYFISDLGMPKVHALKRQLSDVNPFIEVTACNTRIDSKNAVGIFSDCSIVCEAFDNAQAKAMLVNTFLEYSPQTKIVSGSGMAGYGSSNEIKTVRRMKNLYVCGDSVNEACQGNGLMAPRVQVCAGHQANMILRLILGIEDV